ncbi:hypothetical protein EZS27_016893 [termite gut metagenome]|uniref:DUF4348 domain-containing protein n=2 Tax=termite gut metagenome TaxID=433724 RepID=A0A5J4RME9_9ZZZZ
MKRNRIGVFILLLIILCHYACKDKKQESDPYVPVVMSTETGKLTENLPVATPIDELFDDFMYHFTSEEEFQRKRIVFPLPYNDLNSFSKIKKQDWQYDTLFNQGGYYTIFFDREEDMELTKDTSLTSVQVEWIYPEKQIVKKYCFERIKKVWCLNAINIFAMENRKAENFVDFFTHFSNDTLFQQKRIKRPLTFVTNDPDDDFSIIRTTLGQDQWSVFKPEFPTGDIININYGQQNSNHSVKKIVALKSIGNGFSNTLYFQWKEDKWELYKFEDISN